jgi:hypothetical protein
MHDGTAAATAFRSIHDGTAAVLAVAGFADGSASMASDGPASMASDAVCRPSADADDDDANAAFRTSRAVVHAATKADESLHA